jgi:hypothetical protein
MSDMTDWLPIALVTGFTLALIVLKLAWARKQDEATKRLVKWLFEPLMYGWLLAFYLTENPILNVALGYIIGVGILVAKDMIFEVKRPLPKAIVGTDILTEKQGIAWVNSDQELAKTCHARIGKIPIPFAAETMGFSFVGAPGSGKSQAMIQLAESARKRRHCAIVADRGAECAEKFYRANKDIILNPFDQRSVSWSPFAEMRSPMDAAALSWSMVPEGFGNNKDWSFYARTVLYVVLVRLFQTGKPTNGQLCYYLLGASAAETGALCKGTVASTYFEPANEKMLASIRTILSSNLHPYNELDPKVGCDGYSIRNFVKEQGDSWLFLTYREDQLKTLKPMLAAQLDIASSALLSAKTQLDRRLWFFLDEVYSLGFVDSLVSLVSLGRKKGGCPVLGLQSITQLQEVYGADRTETILNCLKNTLMLFQGGNKNEDHMINLLGERKFIETTHSETTNSGSGKAGKSRTTTSQVKTENAIFKGELRNLDPREGILKLDGKVPPMRVTIPVSTLMKVADDFLLVENPGRIDIERPTEDLPTDPPQVPSTMVDPDADEFGDV